MREDYVTERLGTTAGTPKCTNADSIQNIPMYHNMYKREQYTTHGNGK
jgi:hypothetical protein